MKSLLVLLICVLYSNGMSLQLNESILVENYGSIRTKMLKAVCEIAEINNDTIIQALAHNDIKSFEYKVQENDTLQYIFKGVNVYLSGFDISSYHLIMKDMRREVQYRLGTMFPDKEYAIDSLFLVFLNEIDLLTKECSFFNKDTSMQHENYISQYPQGHFCLFIEEQNKADSFQQADLSNQKLITIKKTDLSNTKEEKEMESILQPFLLKFISFLIKCLTIVLLLLIALLAIRNKKRIIRFIKIVIHKMGYEEVDSTNPNVVGNNGEFSTLDSYNQRVDVVIGTPITDPEPQPPIPKPKPKPDDDLVTDDEIKADNRSFATAIDKDEWIVVGASVQGNSHIDAGIPCQDCHGYEYLGEGWGIAITSDGAGSAKFSHLGSAASIARAMVHFKELIQKEEWIKNSILPSDSEWMKKSFQVLKHVRNELEALSKKNKCDIKDLNATIIVVIHSPLGLLVTHVGDGRAAYKSLDGEWHSMMTPHKGEEANQTIFLLADFWNIPFYEMSGVNVPESRVIRSEFSAFTLISDGCESTSWLYNQFNEDIGKYYDPNIPHDKFFNPLIETLKTFRKEKTPLEERKEKWFNFIKQLKQYKVS